MIKLFGPTRVRAFLIAMVGIFVGLLFFNNAQHIQAATGAPLLYQSSLTYVGSFKLPGGNFGSDTFEYSAGATVGNVYDDPVNGKSLFITGMQSSGYLAQTVSMAQIKIPALKDPAVVGDSGLLTATVVQNFNDPSNGKGGQALTGTGTATGVIYNGKLLGTVSTMYDANCSQTKSAWVSPLNFAQKSQATGPYGFSSPVGPRWLGGGYMALIPPEWQSALGGKVVSGNGPQSIISCGSPGPALSVIDADTLAARPSATTGIASIPLVYYQDGAHSSLGAWNSNLPGQVINGKTVPSITVTDPHGRGNFTFAYEDNSMRVRGVLFPDGTSSVLFFGSKGMGPYCYGDGGPCGDPDNATSKGDHAYPYTEFVWAYDVNDLIAAKNGTKSPWDVLPYTGWAFKTFGDGNGGNDVGVAWDPATRLAYVVTSYSTGVNVPIVNVFSIPGSTTPTPVPTPTPAPTPTPPPPPPSTYSACNAPALPVTGTRVINVSTESQLQTAVSNLQNGDTVLLANGTYTLTSSLYVNGKNNITIRGNSGCDNVVIVGRGMDNSNFGNVITGIWTNGLNLTVAHLTIKNTWENAISFNAGAQAPHIYSVKLIDIGSQFVKSNPTDAPNGIGVDNGVMEYCWLEYTSTPPTNSAHDGGAGYFNGISAHAADNWIFRGNLFKNLHNPDSQVSNYWWNPAILMWNHSQNTTVENNTFINTDRAIAYGLTDQTGNDHSGGVIRNNFIYVQAGLNGSARKADSDGAIIVNDSPNTKVYHNTIMVNGNIAHAIEFRFAGSSGGEARNNLADANINLRDGSSATQSGNLLTATNGLFVNPTVADFHLLTTASAAINTAPTLGAVTTDIDGNTRPQGSGYDIGADEFASGAATPVAGDLNTDHIVNSVDWSIMNSRWFTNDSTADLNHDGIVNAIDYSLLNANWFKTW